MVWLKKQTTSETKEIRIRYRNNINMFGELSE